jgi:hypothetical protein
VSVARDEIELWRDEALETIADPDAPPFVRGLAQRIVVLADFLLILLE